MQPTAPKKAIVKSQKCKKKEAKVLSASSWFRVGPLLDDATLVSLDDNSFYLYQMLMTQPDNKSFVFNFDNKMFRYNGSVQVFVTDVIDLMKGASLNISIVQILYM
jgi:hypothetical protein